jgi:hypothetical protein
VATQYLRGRGDRLRKRQRLHLRQFRWAAFRIGFIDAETTSAWRRIQLHGLRPDQRHRQDPDRAVRPAGLMQRLDLFGQLSDQAQTLGQRPGLTARQHVREAVRRNG